MSIFAAAFFENGLEKLEFADEVCIGSSVKQFPYNLGDSYVLFYWNIN